MSTSDLTSRLDALCHHIDRAEARLRVKNALTDGHIQTAAELRQRYQVLSDKLRNEVADVQAHGHHVGDLETSIRQWLDGLEIDTD